MSRVDEPLKPNGFSLGYLTNKRKKSITNSRLAADVEREREREKVRKGLEKDFKGIGGGTMMPNPRNFVKVQMSESDFYELAIFTLRYAMGGGNIHRESIIGDIIRIVGFSSLTGLVAQVFCRDYEEYLKDRERWTKDLPPISDNWQRCYEWFRAFRDKNFYIITARGKVNGKVVEEDHLCFKWNKRYIEAEMFRNNQLAIAYIDDGMIEKVVSDVDWRTWVDMCFPSVPQKKGKKK